MPRRRWFPPPHLSPDHQDSSDPSSLSSFVVVAAVVAVVGSGVADIVAAAVGVSYCRGVEADCDSLVVAVVVAAAAVVAS